MKKVIMLLVDSLIPAVLEKCAAEQKIPALQYLMSNGRYRSDCVTVFPTITASVDCSLLTGTYPDNHRVPGIVWYDPGEKRIVNYFDNYRTAYQLGLERCADDLLHGMNERHLSREVSTIFEDLADNGVSSASVNTFVHRGRNKYTIKLPWLVRFMTGLLDGKTVTGPDELTVGAFVPSPLMKIVPNRLKRVWRKYGFNDDFAIKALQKLSLTETAPDFMLAYLPDNDRKVHKNNPMHANEGVINVDRMLKKLLDGFSSWDEALEKYTFIVVSDHGQSAIGGSSTYQINLDALLISFKVLQLGEQISNHDLVVCNNSRMTYIYPQKECVMKPLLRILNETVNIDLVAWKANGGIRVRESMHGKELLFKPGGAATDIYGNHWLIDGDFGALDLHDNNGIIDFGIYPDALARLHGALHSQDVPMVVITARHRFEFTSKHFPTNLNGGTHGSLHQDDSFIPLIVTGDKTHESLPDRLIDLKKFVLNLLISPNYGNHQ